MAERSAFTLALAGLVLAWGLPELHLGRLIPGDGIAVRLVQEALWWGCAALILAWVMRVERRPLASIGLRAPGWPTFGWGLAWVVPMMASVMLSFAIIIPALGLHQDMATTHRLVAVPLWLQTATMVRAGVCEEILYRGYPIERLTMLTGRRWLAALLALAAFVTAHIGWGLSQFVVVAFGGTLLTALYLWKRDLPACMIAHVLTDTIGFALARAHGA